MPESVDDSEARRKRAMDLRKQIEEINQSASKGKPKPDEPPATSQSGTNLKVVVRRQKKKKQDK